MPPRPHALALVAVALGFVVVGRSLSKRRRPVSGHKSYPSSSDAAEALPTPPPPPPRVFVASCQGGAPEPVRTGASFFAVLSANPTAECGQASGGHRLEGVAVVERSDRTFVLARAGGSAAAAAAHAAPNDATPAVVWRSGPLPLENSAAWHDRELGLGGLPSRHAYCRASACVLAVHEDASGGDCSVLLTRRRRDLRTFPGAWVLPGGGVDQNESLVACAQRELKEETGLCVTAETLEPLCLW